MSNIIIPPPLQPLKRFNPRGTSQPVALPPCCKQERNVTVLWLRNDLRLITCQVCGHKYYRLWAEPGSMGAILGK